MEQDATLFQIELSELRGVLIQMGEKPSFFQMETGAGTRNKTSQVTPGRKRHLQNAPREPLVYTLLILWKRLL